MSITPTSARSTPATVPATMTVAAPSSPVTVRAWNTLETLRAARIAILAFDALLLIAVLVGAGVHRSALQTIGLDSAPSILAAQRIKSALADMDANAANELLVPAIAGAAAQPASVAAYESRRKEASEALIVAAKNITYPGEHQPILTLQLALGTYEQLIQQARDLHQRSDPAAVTAYRAAADIMDHRLLPAADTLDEVNNTELKKAYNGQSFRSSASRLFVLIAGLLATITLLALQVFLSQRTRRTLNPFLAAATLLSFGLTAFALSAFETGHTQLKVAREDAFTSIHALSRARAVAYAANGLESRFLLDAAHAPALEQAFYVDANQLAHLPAGRGDATLAAARSGSSVPGFTGYLADELNNITFDGERKVALKSLETWLTYLATDTRLRQLADNGHTPEAIALCLGEAPGESDWAFAQFDQALTRTLDLNQAAFDGAVKGGFAVLDLLELKAAVVAAIIAVLIFLGLQPRLREYQ